jgi:hypothetical protein
MTSRGSRHDAELDHHEDSPLTIPAPGVLANDTDVDGDPLAASLVDGPAHALAFTLNADGSFTYTPSAFNGTDTFTYRVNDGSLNSNFATVSITVTPPAADLVVTVTHVPAAVNAGAIITYFITITNLGPSTAVNATAKLMVVRNGATLNAGFNPISLPPGASAQFTLSYAVPSDASGTLVATANVTSTTSDPNVLNNSSIDSNTIVPQP